MCIVLGFGLFQLLCYGITELTSIGHHYGRGSVAASWALVLIVIIGLLLHSAADRRMRSFRRLLPELPTISSRGHDFYLGAAILIGVILALVAVSWMYRPSNSDSLAYHLARVEHWIQNNTVDSYASHFTAQNEFAPLMEYNLGALHLLVSSDRLDGYVQLWAVLVCLLGVAELARRLGLSERAQLVASIIVITSPSFLLQATSTTNDDFAAAVGIVCLCVVSAPLCGSGWPRRAIAIGLAVGLAEISKGTLIALLGPAAAVIILASAWKRWAAWGWLERVTRSAGAVVLSAGAALLVAGPFLFRNVRMFGGPGGPVSRSNINAHQSLSGGVGNVLRQISAQFLIGDGSGLGYQVSRAIVTPLGWIFDIVGPRANDATYAFPGGPDPFRPGDFSVLSRFEDVAANPWHTLLAFATFVLLTALAFRARSRPQVWQVTVLCWALAFGFLAFGMLGKWSIYASRYYIPLIAATAPVVAFALGRVPRLVARLVVAGLLLACLPQLFDNYQRPLLHPTRFDVPLQPYFVTGRTAAQAIAIAGEYQQLARSVAESGCTSLGIGNLVLLEYPLWVGLASERWDGQIQHVGVRNASRRLEDPQFQPCALVYERRADGYVNQVVGMRKQEFGSLVLFTQEVG
jgi:hypothetical protein